METRNFPSIGAEVSLLGYGGMRFPTVGEGNDAPIDTERASLLLEHAL